MSNPLNNTATSPPTPSESSQLNMMKITVPVSLGIVFLMLLAVALRHLLKRRGRANNAAQMPFPQEADDLPAPALARFQRALAKGVVGVNKIQLDAAAPVHDVSTTAESETCAICLDELSGNCRTLPCGHTFHVGCVDSWVMRANRCPTCNAPPVNMDYGQKEVIPPPQGRMRRMRGPDGRFTLTPVYDEEPNPLPNTSTMGPHDVVLQVVPLNDADDNSAGVATASTASVPK